jgi:hypothetical protein
MMLKIPLLFADEAAAAIFGKKKSHHSRRHSPRRSKIDQRTGMDCMLCCVAMVLGLPYEAVPDFMVYSEDEWLGALADWSISRGYYMIDIKGDSVAVDVTHGGPFWIASGPAPRGFNHSVVMLGREVWHDPHKSRAGLFTIEAATIFIPTHGV